MPYRNAQTAWFASRLVFLCHIFDSLMRWMNDFPRDENDVPVAFLFQMVSVLLVRFGYGLALLRINSETPRDFSLELRTRSADTVHIVTVLYREQSVERYPTLDPSPPSPDHNSPLESSPRGSSPGSSSSYHYAPASLPPSPPSRRNSCPSCGRNLEPDEICRHLDITFWRPTEGRIIGLQNISHETRPSSFGLRHSSRSISESTSLPSIPESVSPPGLIQDPNIIRNLPQDRDPEVDDRPPLPRYSPTILPEYSGRNPDDYVQHPEGQLQPREPDHPEHRRPRRARRQSYSDASSSQGSHLPGPSGTDVGLPSPLS